jgi:hypothetical protein
VNPIPLRCRTSPRTMESVIMCLSPPRMLREVSRTEITVYKVGSSLRISVFINKIVQLGIMDCQCVAADAASTGFAGDNPKIYLGSCVRHHESGP